MVDPRRSEGVNERPLDTFTVPACGGRKASITIAKAHSNPTIAHIHNTLRVFMHCNKWKRRNERTKKKTTKIQFISGLSISSNISFQTQYYCYLSRRCSTIAASPVSDASRKDGPFSDCTRRKYWGILLRLHWRHVTFCNIPSWLCFIDISTEHLYGHMTHFSVVCLWQEKERIEFSWFEHQMAVN